MKSPARPWAFLDRLLASAFGRKGSKLASDCRKETFSEFKAVYRHDQLPTAHRRASGRSVGERLGQASSKIGIARARQGKCGQGCGSPARPKFNRQRQGLRS